MAIAAFQRPIAAYEPSDALSVHGLTPAHDGHGDVCRTPAIIVDSSASA